ncbi:MAG: hypothetical protein QM636_11075 [Rhizobium sp.]
MKSPWKLLAQLTSRRRPAETPEPSVAEVSGRQDNDEAATADRAAATTANEADSIPDVAQADVPRVETDEVPAQADDEAGRSAADAQPLAPESRTPNKSGQTPRRKQPQRAKRARTEKIPGSVAAASGGQGAQSSSPQDSVFDEMARLDEEIGQLRSQLAKKLHLQNRQLSKMLERFDIK